MARKTITRTLYCIAPVQTPGETTLYVMSHNIVKIGLFVNGYLLIMTFAGFRMF